MQIGLIGAGKWLGLWPAAGAARAVPDPYEERARSLAAEVGGTALASNAAVADRSDLVVLCHKPASCARSQANSQAPAQLSLRSSRRRRWRTCRPPTPPGPFYRFIPSLPVEVRQGAVVQAAGPEQEPVIDAQVSECSRRSARWWCSTTAWWTSRWG